MDPFSCPFIVIRAVAGQRSSPVTCALPRNLLKSMTKDIDLNVIRVGRDGTA